MSDASRRVGLITDASIYVGPHLARALAATGHDLVLGDPHEGLVDEQWLRSSSMRLLTVAAHIRSAP